MSTLPKMAACTDCGAWWPAYVLTNSGRCATCVATNRPPTNERNPQ